MQSSRKRFGLEHREGDLCWSPSDKRKRESHGEEECLSLVIGLTNDSLDLNTVTESLLTSGFVDGAIFSCNGPWRVTLAGSTWRAPRCISNVFVTPATTYAVLTLLWLTGGEICRLLS